MHSQQDTLRLPSEGQDFRVHVMKHVGYVSARTDIEPRLEIVTRLWSAEGRERPGQKTNEVGKKQRNIYIYYIYILYIQNYIVDTEW